MKKIKELGPCIVTWNLVDSVVTNNTILFFKSTKDMPKNELDVLINTCVHSVKDIKDVQYIEVCLKYRKKVNIKEIPFFISFGKELKNPKPTYIAIRSLLDDVRNEKLNVMIVKPVHPIRVIKNKEFYFGGLACWEMITIKEKINEDPLQRLLRETNEMIDIYHELPEKKKRKRKYQEDFKRKIKRKKRLEKRIREREEEER